MFERARLENLQQNEWIFAVGFRFWYDGGRCVFELRSGQSSCLQQTHERSLEKYPINYKWNFRNLTPSPFTKELVQSMIPSDLYCIVTLLFFRIIELFTAQAKSRLSHFNDNHESHPLKADTRFSKWRVTGKEFCFQY